MTDPKEDILKGCSMVVVVNRKIWKLTSDSRVSTLFRPKSRSQLIFSGG